MPKLVEGLPKNKLWALSSLQLEDHVNGKHRQVNKRVPVQNQIDYIVTNQRYPNNIKAKKRTNAGADSLT